MIEMYNIKAILFLNIIAVICCTSPEITVIRDDELLEPEQQTQSSTPSCSTSGAEFSGISIEDKSPEQELNSLTISRKRIQSEENAEHIPTRKLKIQTQSSSNECTTSTKTEEPIDEGKFLQLSPNWDTIQAGNKSKDYEYEPQPLVLIEKNHKFYLPSQAEITPENKIIYTVDSTQRQIYACPKGTNQDLYAISHTSNTPPIYEECLFARIYDAGMSKICEEEILPIILKKKDNNGNPIKCGPNLEGEIYETAFFYCVSSAWLLQKFCYDGVRPEDVQMPEEQFIPIFSFCYNNEETERITIFTKHRIVAPSILANPKLEKERRNESEQIFNDSDYNIININLHILDIYKNQKNSRVKFHSHKMVPRMDMAMSAWKNATIHLVNYRALGGWLLKLMENVENRIREYAIEKNRELIIYTGAFNLTQMGFRNSNFFMNSDPDKTHAVPALWYKIVYDEQEDASVAILFDNLPLRDQEQTQLCKTIKCNIPNWKPFNGKIVAKVIPLVSCCQVTQQIMTLFSDQLVTSNVLDLDNLSHYPSPDLSTGP